MNRRGFFKLFALGSIATALGPASRIRSKETWPIEVDYDFWYDSRRLITVDSCSSASATCLVRNGRLVSVNILNSGAGYK